MTVPYGCKLGGFGVAGSASSYSTQSAQQALYPGGSGRAAAMPHAVQDATVYTPAAQLAAESEVEEAEHGLPAEESMRISALVPIAQEPTSPRTTLWGNLSAAVSRLFDRLTPAPVVESALVLATAEGAVLGGPSISYMTANASDWSLTARSVLQTGSPAVAQAKSRSEKKDVPAWRVHYWWPAPGR